MNKSNSFKRNYFLFLMMVLVGCHHNSKQPSNFAFVFKYGFFPPRNVLNTYSGQFTRDMAFDRDTIVSFHLEENQMDSIYQKMVDIDVFNYPDEYIPDKGNGVSPSHSYYFKITAGDKEKQLWWREGLYSNNPKSKQLYELIHLIERMITGNKQYPELPQSQHMHW